MRFFSFFKEDQTNVKSFGYPETESLAGTDKLVDELLTVKKKIDRLDAGVQQTLIKRVFERGGVRFFINRNRPSESSNVSPPRSKPILNKA